MIAKHRTAVATGWALALGALAFAPLALGQQATAPLAGQPAQQTIGARVFRGSELLGLNVRDSKNEDLGEINDVVVNARSGKAAYVALSVGGVAGVGDKLFAIPFDAFTFVADDKDERAVTADGDLGNVVAKINISQDALVDSQGFDQDHWPNFADPAWRSLNDQAYESIRQRNRVPADDELAGDLVRLSEVVGLNVENASDENVGEVNDVVVDSDSGHVRYIALSVGGFLGMGDKLFAIPLKAFTITKDADGDLAAKLPVTKDSFANATGFDQDHWPNFTDKTWQQENDRSYQDWQAARPVGAVR
jgi:sporulation protein YlmC with PRC-barrel domain